MNLLFLQFNNYFNRIIKRYETVEDYISHSSKHARYGCKDSNGSNFNPNDGIRTERTFNWAEKWNPDYLLCIDSNDKIVSRWFIIHPRRTRNGQYFISLKRDSVAEKLNETLNSLCFVQKGFVTDDNPLIFNREDFNGNQIKKGETFLRDSSYLSWLVIYYNLKEKGDLVGDVTISESTDYIEIGSTLAEWSLYTQYHNNGYTRSYNKRFYVTVDSAGTPLETFVTFNNDGTVNKEGTHQSDSQLEYDGNYINTQKEIKNCISSNKNAILYELGLQGNESTSWADFYKWNDKLIKSSDNKFYRVRISPAGNTKIETTLTSGGLFTELSNAFKIGGTFKEGWSGNFTDAFGFINYVNVYNFDCIPETNATKTIHYDFTATDDPVDAPYGIIAMPYKTFDDFYDKVEFSFFGGGLVTGNLDSNIPLLIAKELCKDGVGASSPVYDVQLLPYCPLVELTRSTVFNSETGEITFEELNDDFASTQVTYLKASDNVVRCISVHVKSCKFTNNLYFEKSIENTKLENQCTFFRLCSPNFNGQFEFSPAKNRGVQSINLDVTLKPYQPYIHLNPDFKGLYGEDYNDARGLICGGDFSLGFVTSAWETYKLQNKNYQEIFNRQIENMDVMHKYGMIEQSASALTGIGAGAMSGMFLTGNPVGAVGGGVASAVGGGIDLLLAQKKFEENKSYAIDVHNYQLDNIKALPDTLTKIDAFNNNNKVFPIIEEYSCTDEEKEIFLNKIKYEGMTINALGKLIDYLNSVEEETFVKGQMVRFENLNEDTNFANDIYEEIAKGVYIYGYPRFN